MAHNTTCALSLRDPRTCTCECKGSLHGRAWIPEAQISQDIREIPSRQRKVRSRQRKVRRTAFAATLAVTATVAGFTLTGNFDTPASASSHLTLQANVDLTGTIKTLAALGFGGKELINSSTSGSSHSSDCADSSTSLVREFFVKHPCELYTTEIWTITQQNTAVLVAFTWVEMSMPSLATQYKTVVDAYGTGNPPGVSSAFNGLCYASDKQGATVWTVELQPTGNISLDQGVLRAAVKGDLSQSYLQKHCIK